MEVQLKTSFKPTAVEPFYNGGKVSVCEDGSFMATTFDDKVFVTNLSTGERIAAIEGDGEVITTMEVSPDGAWLVTCSRSLLMRTYKLPSGELVRSTKAHESPVIVMAIDPTSSLIATGGAEGAVKVWDLEGGYTTHNLRGHGGIISALRFWGRQGTNDWKLASGSDDCKVRVWDLVKSKCIATLDSHVSVVRGLDFSQDGTTLISGGRDRVVNVWDVKKKIALRTTIPVSESLETVGFLKPGAFEDYEDQDEQLVFVGGENGSTTVWDVSRSKKVCSVLHSEDTAEETSVADIIYKPAADLLLTVLTDQTLVQLSIDQDLKPLRRIGGHHGEIIDCTYVGEDETHLAIATNSPEVRILKWGSLEHSVLAAHKDIVIAIDRSLDGRWLATAGKDRVAMLWDLEPLLNGTGAATVHCVFTGHADSIGAIALPRAPGNKPGPPEFLITGSQDLTVKRWSIPRKAGEPGKAEYTRKAHDKDINAIDVSPDNRLFSTASQDRTVKVWDLETGESVGVLRGHKRGVWTVKFSQYDKVIATGSGDKTVKMWSLADYGCMKTFEGHTNSVLKVAFVTKGQQVVSAGGDGLVKVWDVKGEGECTSTLDNHEDKVWSLAAKEDETGFISGGGDGVITFWQDVSEEERQRAAESLAEQVEQEQALDNYVFNKDWKNAIVLALSLDQPYRLLKLFTEVINNNQEDGSISGLLAVDTAIGQLDLAMVERLLLRVRDWNTNGRTSGVAQTVLHVILCHFGVTTLSQVPGLVKLIDALVPYSERHLARMEELVEESYSVDYALKQMNI